MAYLHSLPHFQQNRQPNIKYNSKIHNYFLNLQLFGPIIFKFGERRYTKCFIYNFSLCLIFCGPLNSVTWGHCSDSPSAAPLVTSHRTLCDVRKLYVTFPKLSPQQPQKCIVIVLNSSSGSSFCFMIILYLYSTLYE